MNPSIATAALFAMLAFGTPGARAHDLHDHGETGARLTVIATVYPLYIMALNVVDGVAGVRVESMTPQHQGCQHELSLGAGAMKRFEDADVLLVNGAGMESPDVIRRLTELYPRLRIMDASAGIELIRDDNDVPNPHLWVSLRQAAKQVATIARGLGDIDAPNRAQYATNAAAYLAKLDALETEFRQALADVGDRRLVTFHDAFSYFARDFDLQTEIVLMRNPDAGLSPRQLGRLVAQIRDSGIRTVFAEPHYPRKLAQRVVADTDAEIRVLDPAATGPDDKNAYLTIMRTNLDTLVAALK